MSEFNVRKGKLITKLQDGKHKVYLPISLDIPITELDNITRLSSINSEIMNEISGFLEIQIMKKQKDAL